MKVAAVIINYRTPEMTADAVDALLVELAVFDSGDSGGSASHLFVVDNDSQDGSIEALEQASIRRGWGDRATVIAAPRNGGYGYGINVAIARARERTSEPPEYFYVLNSDAKASPGALAKMVAYMELNSDVGLVGSEIRAMDGTTQGAAFRFPSFYSEFESNAEVGVISSVLRKHVVSIPTPEESCTVDWLPGTSMLIRWATIESVGLFDEGFFLYFEEVDYCRRVSARGWRCCFVADAPIMHVGAASTGLLDNTRRMPRYWFESRHRYFLKHHGLRYAIASDVAWLAGYAVSSVRARLTDAETERRPHFVRDFIASTARDLVLRP